MQPLVEEISTRTGRYLPGVSNEAEPKPSNLYAVMEDKFTAGKEKDYVVVYDLLNKALRKAGADLYWTSAVMEDGRVYNGSEVG